MARFISLALGRVAIIFPITAALVLAAVACGDGDAPAPMPASRFSEPGLYTRAFVEQAIERYEAEGRDETIAYHNAPESVDGDWYVFIIDEDGAVVSHPTRPERRGVTFEGMVDVTGYNYGADFAAATDTGRWVEYAYLNPVNANYERKHTWVIKRDGLIFGSGWYERSTASLLPSKSDEPDKYTKAFVEQAIRRYESQGRDATVTYYNTPESVDGQWYVFIIDEEDRMVSNADPDRIGEDIKGNGGTDVTGYYFGDDLLAAASEGGWIDYTIGNPGTGEPARKHSWVVRHDGLIFGSGWYEAVAPRDGQDFEAGPLGAVEVAPGEVIQIRSMQVLTGIGDLGTPNQRGVEMALADYGPIKGRDVSMGAGLDSLCTAEGGHAAAETVTGDPRVVGVIGTSCSVAAVAASPVLSEAGLVMIAPSNTSPSLTSDLRGNAGPNYRPGYYRTANNDLYQARAVARFAYDELGLRRMAAIHDGDPYTSGLTTAFTTAFEALGGSVSVASISRGDTDMVPTLTGIATGGPDGLFFPLFQEEGTYIVKQVGQVAGLEDVTLIGGAALLVSEFLAVPESEGVYLPGPYSDFGGNTNEATGKSGEALVADYRDRYGEASTSAYLPHAYDAATMLLRAIEEVAVEDGDTLYIDRTKLREALTGIAGFRGIIGVISCDEFGDCGTGGIQIAHHTDPRVTDVANLPVVYRFAP